MEENDEGNGEAPSTVYKDESARLGFWGLTLDEFNFVHFVITSLWFDFYAMEIRQEDPRDKDADPDTGLTSK